MCKREIKDIPSLVPNTFDFSVHHIVPRDNGGKTEIDNLIGLCTQCHDIAEKENLNRKEIENYYNNREKINNYHNKKDGKKAKRSMLEVKEDKDWYAWVYGGCKRPTY